MAIKLMVGFLITVYMATSVFCDFQRSIIKSLHITSNIKYTYAKTSVISHLMNPANVSNEVHFKVVLPEEAFITGFEMTIKGKSYESYIKDKEDAKKDYRTAVSRGDSAGHIFQTSSRYSKDFTVSVNVEAEEKVKFNLTYEELLSRKNRTYQHKININPHQIVHDLSIIANIEDVLNISYVEVPQFRMTNEIDEPESKDTNIKKTIISPNNVRVEWSPTEEEQMKLDAEGLNGQLVINYDVDASKSQQQLLVDEDGYFVHIFRNDDLPVLNKHVIFVLDVSGSMSGNKIEQLKQAMQKILSDLSELDYFSIVLFSVKILPWRIEGVNLEILNDYPRGSEPVIVPVEEYFVIPASIRNIKLALQFIKSFDTYGGTNIDGALRVGIDIAKKGQIMFENSVSQVEPMIIFLTDGEPSYEEENPDKIIKNVDITNTGKVAIFSLGFGFDLDMNFLKKLSLSNGGFARRIYEDSDASMQLNNFYKEVASPVLSDVKFMYLPDQVENATSESKNLFNGSSLVGVGKVKDNCTLSGSLSAITPQGRKEFPIREEEIVCLKENKTTGYLEKMWVYKTIKSLLDQNLVSKNKTIEAKAKKLALEYKFVTPLTSLVIVQPNGSLSVDDKLEDSNFEPQQLNKPTFQIMSKSSMHGAGFTRLSPDILSVLRYRASVSQYKKIRYSSVTWLNHTVSNDGLFLRPPVLHDQLDVISLNETDTIYNSTSCGSFSNCRHFIFCALDVFANNYEDFLPFKCHINPNFLGVCCPH